MSNVLVVVGLNNPLSVDKADAEAMTFARQIAEDLDGTLTSVAIAADGSPPPDAATHDLARFGVEQLQLLVNPALANYAPAAWARAVATAVDTLDTTVVVIPASDRGAEVMAHLAAHLDLPLAANCVAMHADDNAWSVTRLRWGGVLLEDAQLTSPIALVTVAPHQIAASSIDPPASLTVTELPVTVDDADLVGVVEEMLTHSEGISLATADVVISGGRGVGSAEGFAVLEELADLVGGAVGCSRVATNNGWRSHSDQVGQTGTRVAPDLYVACGISGATQHWVGCMSSKKILAINTDEQAPMVTRADYAVLGDLHEILPAVVAEIRRRQSA